MKIGEKIVVIRKMRGYSQEYVSMKLKISQSAYGKVERDQTDLTLGRLKEISDILGLPNPADLLLFDIDELLAQISTNYKGTKENSGGAKKEKISFSEQDMYDIANYFYESDCPMPKDQFNLYMKSRDTMYFETP